MNKHTVRLTTRLRNLRSRPDQGFTLIELLVVIIIIGILAAIAIPLSLSQRTSAWQASVKADVHGAVLAVETYTTANSGTMPAAGTVNNTSGVAATKSQISTSSVTLTVSAGNKIQLLTSGNYYTVIGSNQNVGTSWFYVYNSAQGSGATATSTPTAVPTN